MGFFNTLFQQATPAPVQERMMQPIPPGVPQSPAVQPPPGVQPQPQQYTPPTGGPQQFLQGQPGSTPTPVVDQGKVDQWSALMNRIVQPDVLGPLQTFLAAASAPLEPGENLGARLGYAGTLMNLHKSMLEENARLAPYLQKERDLKIQQMEGEIARNRASTESSQAQTQRTRQQTGFELADRLGDVEGKELGRKKTKQELEDSERKAKRDEKYGDRKEESVLATAEQSRKTSRAQELYYGRLPQASGTGAGGTKSKTLTERSPQEIAGVINSLTQTFRATGADKQPGADFIKWVSEVYDEKYAREINDAMAKLQASGGKVNWGSTTGKPGSPKGGKIDAQGNYIPNK